MDVNEYRACMSTRMKDKIAEDLSKEERKILFSVSAKICSGKAENEKEARAIIKNDHPEWFDQLTSDNVLDREKSSNHE